MGSAKEGAPKAILGAKATSGHASRILLIEDERAQRDPLARYLRKHGYDIDAVATGEEGKKLLDSSTYDVLVTDLRLPGMDGLAVVRYAHDLDEELGVLLMTAYASVESAVEALRLGAHDYFLKPLILDEVGRKIANLLEYRSLARDNARLQRALADKLTSKRFVSESAAMREANEWAERAAKSPDTNVLIIGETGTGKEVMARLIHSLGDQSTAPFVAINLAAIPETMMESELFGHERGAFTGAEKRRDGALRTAGTGTVFLDEIGELSLAAQAKLLRAIEVHEVQPLGSDISRPFEARIIAATNRNLEELVEKRLFREDLFYRLNVLRIMIPPLRERPDDVPALVHHLLAEYARSSGKLAATIDAEAMRALCRHPWRGNVRELKNVLERALILAEDACLELEHLPADIGPVDERMDLQLAVARFERSHIAMVLRLCEGSRERAAKELGISQATLYRRLERHELKDPQK